MDRGDLERELEALHPASWGWALGCCRRNRDEAEEVLQTVYLGVLEGRMRFEERSSLKTWLFAVIRRTAASLARRRWLDRLRFHDTRVPERIDPGENADGKLERSQTVSALLEALGHLSRRQRQTLELVFYHDVSVEEAAAILGISPGSARVHYHRGKKALGAMLAPGRDRR